MANHRRGEVDCIIGERLFPLRLTLGALAEIEAAFGAEDLSGLGERFKAGIVKTTDLIALVGAALRGGGAAFSDADVAAMVTAADLPGVIGALGRLFALTFGEEPSTRPFQARRRQASRRPRHFHGTTS